MLMLEFQSFLKGMGPLSERRKLKLLRFIYFSFHRGSKLEKRENYIEIKREIETPKTSSTN